MDATPSLEILDLYLHLTEFGGKNRFRSNYNKKFSINSFKFKWVKMKYNLKFSSSVTLPPYKCTGLHVACIYQQALGSWTRKCDGSRTSGDEKRGGGLWGEIIKATHALVTWFSEAAACWALSWRCSALCLSPADPPPQWQHSIQSSRALCEQREAFPFKRCLLLISRVEFCNFHFNLWRGIYKFLERKDFNFFFPPEQNPLS